MAENTWIAGRIPDLLYQPNKVVQTENKRPRLKQGRLICPKGVNMPLLLYTENNPLSSHSVSKWNRNATSFLCLNACFFLTFNVYISNGVCVDLYDSVHAHGSCWPAWPRENYSPPMGGWSGPTRDRWLPVCPRSTYSHRPHTAEDLHGVRRRDWPWGRSTASTVNGGGRQCSKVLGKDNKLMSWGKQLSHL